MDITITQRVSNPVRELSGMEKVLQIAPFEKSLKKDNPLKYLSMKLKDFLLDTHKHPKLLVPYAISDIQ